MDESPSLFFTESFAVALPGYRWVEFLTHRARQPLATATPRQVLEKLVADPAFVNEYFSIDRATEVIHGPYRVEKIGAEDFIEGSIHQEPHPVLHAILHGTGAYEGRAPAPDMESLERIKSHLAEVPKDSSYLYLNLDLKKDVEKLSELGGVFIEYSQHFFISSKTDSIHVVTIACE